MAAILVVSMYSPPVCGWGGIMYAWRVSVSPILQWGSKAAAPFMRSHYHRVTVAFESLHGLIE